MSSFHVSFDESPSNLLQRLGLAVSMRFLVKNVIKVDK
jgi:hypothetical protein